MAHVSSVENESAPSSVTATRALSMSGEEIDDLFRSQSVGPIPEGRAIGTALIATGTPASKVLAGIARVGFWQGKTFNPMRQNLKNRLSPLGIPAIVAKVEFGDSVLDGQPCIVLNYAATSKVAKFIRDEIRQVGPHDYVGMVFIAGRKIPLRFWLRFP